MINLLSFWIPAGAEKVASWNKPWVSAALVEGSDKDDKQEKNDDDPDVPKHFQRSLLSLARRCIFLCLWIEKGLSQGFLSLEEIWLFLGGRGVYGFYKSFR